MDDLGRAWRRRVLAAGGVAAIAPVAMVTAALAVGLGGGGASRIGALGQAFSGPQEPSVGRPVLREPPRASRSRDPSRLLAELDPVPERTFASRRAARGPGSPGSSSPGTGGGADGPRLGPLDAPGGTQAPAPTPGRGRPPAPPSPAATPAPSPSPQPEPDRPGIVGQTGDEVESVLEPLPGVEPPAAGAVDETTQTVDEILP